MIFCGCFVILQAFNQRSQNGLFMPVNDCENIQHAINCFSHNCLFLLKKTLPLKNRCADIESTMKHALRLIRVSNCNDIHPVLSMTPKMQKADSNTYRSTRFDKLLTRYAWLFPNKKRPATNVRKLHLSPAFKKKYNIETLNDTRVLYFHKTITPYYKLHCHLV